MMYVSEMFSMILGYKSFKSWDVVITFFLKYSRTR